MKKWSLWVGMRRRNNFTPETHRSHEISQVYPTPSNFDKPSLNRFTNHRTIMFSTILRSRATPLGCTGHIVGLEFSFQCCSSITNCTSKCIPHRRCVAPHLICHTGSQTEGKTANRSSQQSPVKYSLHHTCNSI